jgi:LmbE family N-acetylglucosaminyl deacetylase
MKQILLLLSLAACWAADLPPQGAAKLKTDLMFVGAHPDDETGIAATLARYAGAGKTVATVYCTRGEGGGNMVGTQAGAALGILREAELRSGLGKLGVQYIYFLDEEDFFYTESLAATLEKWDKQDVLGKLVRVVRSLRPDVVVTMNPTPNPGQHGHHQAAGVLAIEAFTAAADSYAFPEQLDREGLSAWQVRKLYISGGGGLAVEIRTDEPMANGLVPADLAATAIAEHRSQAFGNFGNSPWLRRPQSFRLARSAIESEGAETDLLDHVDLPVRNIAGKSMTYFEPALAFVPRPAITRFIDWARRHYVSHLASGFSADVPVTAGEVNEIAFRGTGRESLSSPEWEVVGRKQNAILVRVPEGAREDVELRLTNDSGTEASVRLHPVPAGRIPRADLNASGAEFLITTNLLVQGRLDDEADSGGTFRLNYDQDFLFVKIAVRDEAIVTNIEPDDIKGHWRTDSVEICIDPDAGAEHTMRCFKLAIFPFDSAGNVRAARDADANQGPIERTAPGVKLTSERASGGYNLSAAIPWKHVGVTPRKNLKLGFNIIIYDGDKRDAAPGENINQSRLAWSPRPGVQGRPEDWGRVVLE